MLKRNGEECRFEVPHYSGRLSASEQQAYAFASKAVAEEMGQFKEAALALTNLSKELQNVGKDASALVGVPIGSLGFSESDGGRWQIRRSLFKTTSNELLLCSRQTAGGQDYGIVEKFDPTSAYARAQGDKELIITGNNVVLLLQDYVRNECRVLEAFKHDLEARVEEVLAEQYPGENFSRVVKAVSAQCSDGISVDAPSVRAAKSARGVKLRI